MVGQSCSLGGVRGTGRGRSGCFLLLGEAASTLVVEISPPHPVSCPDQAGEALSWNRPESERLQGQSGHAVKLTHYPAAGALLPTPSPRAAPRRRGRGRSRL